MVFNKMKYYKNVKAIRKVFGTSIKWLLEYIISEKAKCKKTHFWVRKIREIICVYTYLYPHILIIKQIQFTKMEKMHYK